MQRRESGLQVENAVYHVRTNRRERWLDALSKGLTDALPGNAYPLRFSIVEATDERAVVEATVVRFPADHRYAKTLSAIELFGPRRKTHQAQPFGVVQIIPTGVRCEIGGYAGDACPVTNLLASVVDVLVTHPNAVNASDLNEMADNVWYVEGKSLDDFLLGHLGLLPVRSHKIGTFVDPTGREYLDDVVSTLEPRGRSRASTAGSTRSWNGSSTSGSGGRRRVAPWARSRIRKPSSKPSSSWFRTVSARWAACR